MTRKGIERLGRAAVLTGMAALWLTAPAWAQKNAEKAAEDRKGFRASVVAIRGQIDTTLKALNGIPAAKDEKSRKNAFKKYGDELKSMDKQIQKTKDYAKSMKERGQAYFKEWEKSTSQVTNPALQANATQRREELKAQYDKIEASIQEAKVDSSKFWKDLQDLQKYYAADLSDNAVATSADLVKTTTEDGKKIQGYIDKVVEAVDQVGKVQEKPAEMAAPEQKPPEEAKPQEEKPPEQPAEQQPAEEKPPEDKPPVPGIHLQ
jgi:chromosome segregation ATPase